MPSNGGETNPRPRYGGRTAVPVDSDSDDGRPGRPRSQSHTRRGRRSSRRHSVGEGKAARGDEAPTQPAPSSLGTKADELQEPLVVRIDEYFLQSRVQKYKPLPPWRARVRQFFFPYTHAEMCRKEAEERASFETFDAWQQGFSTDRTAVEGLARHHSMRRQRRRGGILSPGRVGSTTPAGSRRASLQGSPVKSGSSGNEDDGDSPSVAAVDDAVPKNSSLMGNASIAAITSKMGDAVGRMGLNVAVDTVQELRATVDWFDNLALFIVLLNVVAIALTDPLDKKKEKSLSRFIDDAEYFFVSFFILEVVVRMICFTAPKYFSSISNIFDFLVVLSGVADLILQALNIKGLNFTALRAGRIFRPLGKLTIFPNMRMIVRSIVTSFTYLTGVGIVYLIFLLIFGVAAIGQFKGRLHGRCVNDAFFTAPEGPGIVGNVTAAGQVSNNTIDGTNATDGLNKTEIRRLELVRLEYFVCGGPYDQGKQQAKWEVEYADFLGNLSQFLSTTPPPTTSNLPTSPATTSTSVPTSASPSTATPSPPPLPMEPFDPALMFDFAGRGDCNPDQLCDFTDPIFFRGFRCPYNYTCLKVSNPYHGFVGFDHIAQALLTLFTVVTLENWHDIMYLTVDGTSTLSALYFIAVVVLGAFFIVNITVAIVTMRFEEQNESDLTLELSSFGEDNSDDDLSNLWPWQVTLYENVTSSEWFSRVTNVITIGSLVFVAMEHHNMSPQFERITTLANWTSAVLFTVEGVLRIAAGGFRNYVRHILNVIDVVVIAGSWVDILVASVQMPYVRALRVVRILKLTRGFPTFHYWMSVLVLSLRSGLLLILLMAFITFIFATLGMTLWGGEMCGYGEDPPYAVGNQVDRRCRNRPRANFDSIGLATLTAFQVLTGDDWNLVMYNTMRAASVGSSIVVVAYFCVTNYILLNLFIGILVSVSGRLQKADVGESMLSKAVKSTLRAAHLGAVIDEDDFDDVMGDLEEKKDDDGDEEMTTRRPQPIDTSLGRDDDDILDAGPSNGPRRANATFGLRSDDTANEFGVDEEKRGKYDDVLMQFSPSRRREARVRAALVAEQRSHTNVHPVRRYIQRFLSSGFMSTVIVALVLLACVSMALEDPNAPPDLSQQEMLSTIVFSALSFFVLEMIVSVLVFGLRFLRDPFNRFDFVIVLCCAASIAVQVTGNPRSAQVLRTILPLRLLRYSPGIQAVYNSLVSSFASIIEILAVGFVVYAVFGIVGVQLFQGALYSCEGFPFLDEGACETAGGKWKQYRVHFDHFPGAMNTLFEVASLEGWAELMYRLIDSTGKHTAPVLDSRPQNAIFLILFILAGAFFFINLFVSVLLDSFNSQRKLAIERQGAASLLTPEQEAWLSNFMMIVSGLPDLKSETARRQTKGGALARNLARIANEIVSPTFDQIMYCLVIFNFCFMLIEHEGQPEAITELLANVNIVFVVIYVLEAMIRIAADPEHYFRGRWTRLDFVIVIAGVCSLVADRFKSARPVIPLLKAIRVLRIIRVLKAGKRVRLILRAFYMAMLSLTNVVGLLSILVFSFALLGIKLFARIKWGEGINHSANFSNFRDAILLMFRVSTGGNWQQVMEGCDVAEPDCNPNLGECTLQHTSPVFFIIFFIVSKYILLNLFVAVILDALVATETYTQEVISEEDVGIFVEEYGRFDRHWGLRVPPRAALEIIRTLSGKLSPLSYDWFNRPWGARWIIELRALGATDIPVHDGKFILLPDLVRFCTEVYTADLEITTALLLQIRERALRRFMRILKLDNPALHSILNEHYNKYEENEHALRKAEEERLSGGPDSSKQPNDASATTPPSAADDNEEEKPNAEPNAVYTLQHVSAVQLIERFVLHRKNRGDFDAKAKHRRRQSVRSREQADVPVSKLTKVSRYIRALVGEPITLGDHAQQRPAISQGDLQEVVAKGQAVLRTAEQRVMAQKSRKQPPEKKIAIDRYLPPPAPASFAHEEDLVAVQHSVGDALVMSAVLPAASRGNKVEPDTISPWELEQRRRQKLRNDARKQQRQEEEAKLGDMRSKAADAKREWLKKFGRREDDVDDEEKSGDRSKGTRSGEFYSLL